MPKVALLDIKGAQVGEIELSDGIFGIEPNSGVVHEAVVMQTASLRRGTTYTKSRGEVRGGGRKPWRQKGTGRARAGTSRSPLWRGGSIIFGPKQRDYSYSIPKKKRRLALKSVLSAKVQDGELLVVDKLELDAPKTREMVAVVENMKLENPLFVTSGEDFNVSRSVRNIPNADTAVVEGLNVYEMLLHKHIVMTASAVAKAEEVFA